MQAKGAALHFRKLQRHAASDAAEAVAQRQEVLQGLCKAHRQASVPYEPCSNVPHAMRRTPGRTSLCSRNQVSYYRMAACVCHRGRASPTIAPPSTVQQAGRARQSAAQPTNLAGLRSGISGCRWQNPRGGCDLSGRAHSQQVAWRQAARAEHAQQ